MTTLAWKKAGRSRAWRSLAVAAALIVGAVALSPVIGAVFPRHGGTVTFWTVLIATILLVRRAMHVSGRWAGVGLFLDDTGVTLGSREPVPDARRAISMPQRLHYRAPWSAIYDAVLVTDPKDAKMLGTAAWQPVTVGRGSLEAARRPPHFVGDVPLLTFRVDLHHAEVPDLAHPPAHAWAGPALLSHVWAVPLRDVEAVTREFERHGIPVRPCESWSTVGPTREEAMDAQVYQEWLEAPFLLDEEHPKVHRDFTGPHPTTLAEYEAACHLEHGDTRRITDEVSLWSDEQWMRANLRPGTMTGLGRARLFRDYVRHERRHRAERRQRYGR